MRTNVLNDLSNVVKKGTSLACSWSQVGRMSEGAPDEHPMSIRSASDGERWKPAGEKGSTRVWKHVAMIFAVLVMSIANIGMAWAQTSWVRLDSINFTNTTNFPAVTYTNQSATVHGVFFRAKIKKNVKVNNTTPGVDFDGTNISNGDHGIAIPVTGVNGSLKVIVYHDYNNSSAYHRVGVSHATGNDPSATQTWDLSPTSDGGTKNKNDFVMTKSSLAGTDYIVWVGEASSTYKVIKRVAIYTEAPACTSISPSLSYTSTSLMVGDNSSAPTLNKDGSAGAVTWTSSDEDVATVNSSGVVTAEGAGSATITATIEANGGKCEGTATANFTVTADPLGSHTLTWNITTVSGSSESNVSGGTTDIGTSSTASTSTYLTSLSNLTGVGVKRTTTGKNSNTGKIETPSSYDADKYVTMTFAVASGYQFTPSSVSIKTVAVTTTKDLKFEISDASGSYSVTKTSLSTSSTAAENTLDFSGCDRAFTGTVTVKIYVYGAADLYRLSTPLTIDGTVAAAVAPSCTAPSSVGISGEWRYFPGQTISLTATPTGGVGTPAYQWQKEVSADVWENISNGGSISGATSNNLQISSCGTGNTGKYRCIVSTGATCSTNSDPFSVKIFTLNGAYDDGEFSSNNITFTSGTTGTATVHLAAGRVYKFKVTDNFGMWFGNSGRILEPASSWTFPSNNSDNCILFTGPEGDYTFTVDIAHVTYGTPEVVVSVAYPDVTHPSAGYAYFRNVDNWTNVGLYMWYEGGGSYTDWGSEPWVTRTTTICGNTYYYTPLIPSWYNRAIFREVGGSGQTGNIEYANLAAYSGKYNDKSDANWHEFTTYTISFNAGGGEGTMSSITGICPDADQVLPANAFEKTGYTFAGWKDASANEYADEATIEDISDDITLTAQWSPIPVTSITVSPSSKTLDVGGTQTLTATVAPATALDKAVTWSTSNGSIATVNASGVVTAVAPGSCTITATAHDGSGVTGTCSITVNKIQPTKYSFSVDKTTLCGGETATLTLEDSEDGVTYELRSDATHSIADTQKAGTGSALTWTGLGAGTYVVYAVADATYTERQMDGSKITVTAATATSITTQPTNQEVTVGEEATLTVVAAGTSLSYQWKESATEDGTYSNVASGGTSSSYSVTPVAAGTKWYKCVVTGTCGEVTTEARKIVANAAKITPTVTWTTVPSTVYKGGKYAIEVSTNTDASLVAGNLTCTNGTLSGVAVSDGVFTGYLEIATNASSAPTLTLTTSAGSTYAAKTETNDDIELGNCEGGGGSTIYSYTITSISDVTGGSATGGSVDIKGLDDTATPIDEVDYYKIGGNFKTDSRHIKITLSGTTLAAGDVITLFDAVTSNDAGTFILYDSEGTARYTYGNISTKNEVTEQKYTITAGDGLVGSSVFYIGRNGSNGRIRTITITRPGGGSSQTTNLTWSGGLVDGGSVDKTVGDANFTYSTSSNNSNGAISYSSGTTSVATINSSTGEVTIVSAGSTTITATIAESGCYPTKSITYTLTVTATCTSVDAPTALTCSEHTSGSLTFTWTEADHASTYTAKLYSDAECTSQVASQALGDVSTVTFNTLIAETTYYCQVQSHGDGSTYCTAGGTTSAQSGTTDAACTAHGLAYGTAAVAKNVGDAAFTNALTNPNSLSVSYSSSVTSVATVNATSGMVTIVGAGSTVITATWAGNATYCAGTATYTLTVSSGCTPQSLSKVSATKGTSGTVTGYNDGQYAGDAVVNLYSKSPQSASLSGVGSVDGYKMGDAGTSIVFATLKGTSFQVGDKVRIGITRRNDMRQVDSKYNILTIYYGTSKSDAAALTTITTGGDNDDSASGDEGAGFYEYTLTSADVTAIGSKKGIGLFRESSSGENPYVYSVEIIGCREWAVCTAPDAIAVGSVTATGATFTITDALNTNNYEIYYSTSSTAPTAETSATVSGISSKSRAVTGLTAETTYYYWVRSNCGGATKSSWVAGTPASFTTEAAAATHNVTYNGNGSTGGSVPTDDNDYEEGDVVTVLGNTGSLVKTGQTFLGWSTNATASSGTFYPAGYKFYMPNAAVTLYAVWGSAGEEKYYYGQVGITDGALVKGAANTLMFFTNEGGVIASSTALTMTTSNLGTGPSCYYNSNDLTHTGLNKSSNWGTSSGANKYIRGLKWANGKSYTLGLGTKAAISIMFYGWAGAADKTLTIGGVEYTSTGTSFFSNDFTKVGNFTGNVTIACGGDFYGILVITISTGAASGHTVSFDMNDHGSAIADIENVPSGSKIGAPVPSPTAVGAEFGGWYREAGCTNAWNFGSSTISKDTTLYAKWTTCAPSISAHPVAATYTQGDDATALSVTASGEGLNYQWYTSEEAGADIQGSSAIPGATSASYTPSTSLLGTIYYFCVVSNTCGNAVSNKAAITVNDSKPAPTANWDIEEPEEGGKGFTFSIEVNKNNGDNWDGELIASMLTLSDNAILDGASIVVNNTNKTISGTYGVKAGSSSPVTFYLLLPATATQSATRLDHDRAFNPCAGGAGDSYNVRVRKDYEKDASNNYRWVTPGAGEITYAVNSSISSAKASSAVGEFDSIMSNDKQYVWVKTYEANTKTIRLHVETSGANISVNALYKNTVYATAADKDIVSSDDYSVSYDGSGSAENTGTKGTHYMDITFDSPLAANDIICVKFSSSKVKAYGAVLTTVGDGGDQTTGLTWSNSQASGATVEKQEDAADFTITAVRDATALKSLGLISYTSSNTAIATVNASTGLVHIADNIDFGSDEFKTTTITATLAASGCYKKASITYTLRVNKYVCADTPGTITYVDNGCSGMVLTLEGYEAGATVQWYNDGSPVGTNSATYNATEPGEYYAVSDKNCDITSTNSVKLERAAATAEKIVDSWYVKNGRRTPDIALVQTTGATSFTVTSGGTITEIGGCTFELKDDGIIYLHGQKEDGSAPSDMTPGDMTITITVSGCAGALDGLDITLHIQAETAKPSVAFVVDGTLRKDGGTATSVSADKTSNRPLWTYLSSSYALTGCNAYWSVDSKELRQYYSQFDAILITDDPSTDTKGTGGVSYVKAFGTMVDVRPVLTMEAFVGKFKDGGWHVYDATPTSPNPRQVEMKLECKNHDIFKGLDPETSDNVRTTTDEHGNEHWHVIMVDTTVAPYHNTSKDYKDLPALQGFDPHKFDHMLGVGTIAEETLQGGVERQEEPAARMMILGVQNEAMAALTNEGKLIIKNAIEYLLKTNMEDVNDCSNYFTDETGNGLWNDAGNWTSNKVPDFESRVRILKPVVVPNEYHAIVARVDIATSGKSKWIDGTCNGSVTINPQGALTVGGKIRRADAPHYGIDDLMPTENDDLIVKAATTSPHYQGALIFDNSDGDTRAVVEMWNPSHWDVVDGKKKKYWSYVAVPIQEADIPNFFWYGFTYLYDETSGWIKKSDGTSLYPFQGIGASLQSGNMETFYGPLATTESQDITLTKTDAAGKGMNLIGNSWTAPIQIANFEEDDFGDAAAEVWVFNTGNKNDGTPGSGSSATPGQWNTIPINAPSLPGYEGLKVIPAMQAFEVNTTSETTLHLDYDRLVRAGRDLNEPMRAPRRGSAAKQIEATMRVRVSGELTHTDVYLLKDARFSDAFDNGWDGHYLSGDDRSAQLYAISEAEGELAFLAQPEIEGTQLGFAPSKKDTEYTFSFSYDGEEPLYLNDLKLKESTLIDAENTYLFTYEEGDAVNRFYISATPFEKPNIATGTETIGHPEKVQKVMYKDHIYIIRGGKVFDVVGKMVK